jgi:hypothetical protein
MDARSSENIKEIMGYVENIFKVIDRYDASRPGQLGFTKLEEAILWLQVMAQQVSIKEKRDEAPLENKVEVIDAA